MKFNKKWLKITVIIVALIFISMFLVLHYYRRNASFVPPGDQLPHSVTPVLGPHADSSANEDVVAGANEESISTSSDKAVKSDASSLWRLSTDKLQAWWSRWRAKELVGGDKDNLVGEVKSKSQENNKEELSPVVSSPKKDKLTSAAPAAASRSTTYHNKTVNVEINKYTNRPGERTKSESKPSLAAPSSAIDSTAKPTEPSGSAAAGAPAPDASFDGPQQHNSPSKQAVDNSPKPTPLQHHTKSSSRLILGPQHSKDIPASSKDSAVNKTTVLAPSAVKSKSSLASNSSKNITDHNLAAKRLPVVAGNNSAAATASVIVAKVKSMPLHIYIRAVGTLKAMQSIDVAAEVAGRISKINFQPGQYVNQGDILVELDNRIYKANLKAAQNALLLSRSNYQRYKKIASTGAVSAQQLQQALSLYKQDQAKVTVNRAYLAQTILRAPFSGYVGAVLSDSGSYVNKGTAITNLVNRKKLTVVYLLPEKYRANLKLQQRISIHVSSDDLYNDSLSQTHSKIFGVVSYISPQVDETTHSVTVQADIDNSNDTLTPGDFVQVKQQISSLQNALMVPQTSILPTLEGMKVYRVVSGRVHSSLVAIGERHGGLIQVISGLNPGDTVVTAGLRNLHDGQKVQVVTDSPLTSP